MANLTPPTVSPSGIKVTWPNSRFLPTRSLQNGENGPARSNHLPVHLDKTKSFRKQPQYLCHPPTPTTPNNPSPSGYCQHSNYRDNHLITCEDTPNQARAFPHTSQNSPRLNIAVLEAITALQPPPNDTQRSFTTRLLIAFQFLWKLLENSRRFTQSSASPPPHHPKFTSITHCHFGNNHGTAAIHRQHQMIPHHQAIASTPILVEIA